MLACFLIVWAGNLQAQVYKCSHPDGGVTFSDQPCPRDSQVESVDSRQLGSAITMPSGMAPDPDLERRIIQKYLDSGVGGERRAFFERELRRIDNGQYGQLTNEQHAQRRDVLERLNDPNATRGDKLQGIREIDALYPPPFPDFNP